MPTKIVSGEKLARAASVTKIAPPMQKTTSAANSSRDPSHLLFGHLCGRRAAARLKPSEAEWFDQPHFAPALEGAHRRQQVVVERHLPDV